MQGDVGLSLLQQLGHRDEARHAATGAGGGSRYNSSSAPLTLRDFGSCSSSSFNSNCSGRRAAAGAHGKLRCANQVARLPLPLPLPGRAGWLWVHDVLVAGHLSI